MEEEIQFYSGTSNIVVPVKRSLYPPEHQGKSRLQYYACLFNSIEINSSFYKMPVSKTLSKWADNVPDKFRFTFKLLKSITHVKELAFTPAEVDAFMEIIEAAGTKKGALLIQFPPSLHRDHIDQLDNLLFQIRQQDILNEWMVAVEFRNKSWYHENTYSILNEFNAGMVIHDLPASTPPLIMLDTAFMYLRFHGPGGKYRGSYSDEILQEYANHIKTWLTAGKTVYSYFNNTMGDAYNNLVRINKLVTAI